LEREISLLKTWIEYYGENLNGNKFYVIYGLLSYKVYISFEREISLLKTYILYIILKIISRKSRGRRKKSRDNLEVPSENLYIISRKSRGFLELSRTKKKYLEKISSETLLY
jgi:hypothetical protein